MPPGTMRTSSGGAVVKVWVGRMDWVKKGLAQGMVWLVGTVGTGERVAAMVESVRGPGWMRARVLRMSRGPKASRAWNPGKTRMPKLSGREAAGG
jgi:hypothetical protein